MPITQILDRNQIEAQGYVECQNILDTLGRRNKQRLEAAAAQLLNVGGYASYTSLKRLMAAIDSDTKTSKPRRAAASTAKPSGAPTADHSGVYVRGADYYQQQGR